MKDQIVEYIVKNKLRLKAETASLNRELADLLKKEVPDFHELIKKQYVEKLRGAVVRDISMNMGIDYETSMIELESVDLAKVLE